MIGAVTAGLCSSQARATSAGFSPSSLQKASQASSWGRFSSISFCVSFSSAAAFLDLLQHAAQQAARQRAPRDHAQAVGLAGREHFQFDHAGLQVVQALLADQPHEVAGLGALLRLGDVPAGEVG